MKNKKTIKSPVGKSFKAANLCLDEWHENYNNPEMPECNHNTVLPKIGLCLTTILLVITLIAIL